MYKRLIVKSTISPRHVLLSVVFEWGAWPVIKKKKKVALHCVWTRGYFIIVEAPGKT